tara:strand:+ start:221 stop:358 length:138 start_codon:yes stop_codon:yes gene_type:complete
MAKSLFTTPKLVKAAKVLVTTVDQGSGFKMPAGQPTAAAYKKLFG